MKLILMMALLGSTAALAKTDCKAQCEPIKSQCLAACKDSSKSKKNAAECAKRMCEMAVTQCEQQCGGGNGKKH